jgi:hypothetical protein
MPAVAFDRLEWGTIRMPGSNGAVRLARLPRTADGALRAFVQFPAGWARPELGHYRVAEEFLVLEGELRMNGTTWGAGGYAWVPANRLRAASRSDAGCLAFAWFSSAPDWTPGEPAVPAPPDDVAFAHWRDAPERTLPCGGSARRLRGGPEHTSWIAERRHAALLAADAVSCETLGLRSRAWRFDVAGEQCQDSSEMAFLRVCSRPLS